MQRQLFRQTALDRLGSPDRLDELIEVTGSRLWLALLGAWVLLAVAVGWGLFGSVPTLVRGQGVLIRDGGRQTVVAPDGGVVKDLLVRPGDDVAADQIVARLFQPVENRLIYVISPHTGRVVETRVAGGSVVASGAPLFGLDRSAGPMGAILYLPPTDAGKLAPGMRVQLEPASVKREQAGLLLGRVAAVGAFPAAPAAMERLLGSEELVRLFSANGPPIEVRVELERNPATASGYQRTSTLDTLDGWLPAGWAGARESAGGPPVILRSGTPCTADIVTDERAPIDLVFPGRRG